MEDVFTFILASFAYNFNVFPIRFALLSANFSETRSPETFSLVEDAVYAFLRRRNWPDGQKFQVFRPRVSDFMQGIGGYKDGRVRLYLIGLSESSWRSIM